MIWLIFLGGLVLGGVVTLVLLARLLSGYFDDHLDALAARLPERRELHSPQALRSHFAWLLRTATPRTSFYLNRVPDGLKLRVRRYARKTKADALVLDVPRSGNPETYARLREVLAVQGIPFDEHVTPKRRTPKFLRMKFDDVDKGIAAEATEVVCLLYQTAHGDVPLELALEYY